MKLDKKAINLFIIILIISLLIILVACKKDEVELKKIKKTTAKKTVKASTRSVEKEVQKSESDFLTTPEIDQTYQTNIQTQTPDVNYQQQTQDQATYSQGYDTTTQYDASQDTSIHQTTQATVKRQVGGCPLGSDPACENRNPGDRCATPYLTRGGYCRIPKGGATTCTCMAKMTEKMSMY